MKVCIWGETASVAWLALELLAKGCEVEIVSSGVDTGFRRSPIARHRLEALGRSLELPVNELIRLCEGTVSTRVVRNRRTTRTFLEMSHVNVCEKTLAGLLFAKCAPGLRRWEAPTRFNEKLSTTYDRVILNPRSMSLQDVRAASDAERSDRVFVKDYVFRRLSIDPEIVEFHFDSSLRIVLEPACGAGAIVHVESSTPVALADFEKQLAEIRRPPVGHLATLIERLRPHWIASAGTAEHRSFLRSVGMVTAKEAGAIRFGPALGVMPPLFSLELDCELAEAAFILKNLEAPIAQTKRALERNFKFRLKTVRASQAVLADPWFGRMLAVAAPFMPGVSRSWIGLPF